MYPIHLFRRLKKKILKSVHEREREPSEGKIKTCAFFFFFFLKFFFCGSSGAEL
jgi:hypothetical protein